MDRRTIGWTEAAFGSSGMVGFSRRRSVTLNVRQEDTMLRQFWNAVWGRPKKRVVLVPYSERLPELWAGGTAERREPDLSVLSEASTDVLTELCDNYWDSYFQHPEDDTAPMIRNSTICFQSLEVLAERGPDVIGWARKRLRHPGYDARGDAAYLLGALAAKGQLGAEQGIVASELAALATRPWEEDTKEVQANSVAMGALETIGGNVCLATMRRILASSEWNDYDIQWDAARILSEMTGQGFMETSNPVQAAKDWIRANP